MTLADGRRWARSQFKKVFGLQQAEARVLYWHGVGVVEAQTDQLDVSGVRFWRYGAVGVAVSSAAALFQHGALGL